MKRSFDAQLLVILQDFQNGQELATAHRRICELVEGQPVVMTPRLEIASRIMAGFAAVPESTATPVMLVSEGALAWADALIAAEREHAP